MISYKLHVACVLLISVMAGTSCKKTIDITLNDDDAVVVMNAFFDAGRDSHLISIYSSRNGDATPVAASSLTIACGDEILHTGSSQIGGDVLHAAFHAGDRLTIEAVTDSRTVRAEALVPEKPLIVSCETNLSDETLICYVTLKDKAGEKNWYRISADRYVTFDRYNRYGGFTGTQYMPEYDIEVDTSGDPIISAGFSTDDDDAFSAVVPENEWHIFSDEGFSGESVTLRIDVPIWSLKRVLWSLKESADSGDMEIRNVSASVAVKVYSLSEISYRYLKAATQIQAYGDDFSFLTEPVSLPGNVRGGLGIFAVDMPEYVTISLDNLEI